LIEVRCPKCGEEYADWHLALVGQPLQPVCPACGLELPTAPAVYVDGGLGALEPAADDSPER
jgi:NAD-dependent SIR2 family protein deacetylase